MIKRIETNDGTKLTLLRTTKKACVFEVYNIFGKEKSESAKRTRWVDEHACNWVFYDGMFRRVHHHYGQWWKLYYHESGREIA